MLSRFANALACAGALVFASSARAALATETPVGYMHLSLPGDTASRGTPSGMLGVVVWYPAPSHTVMQPLVVGPPDTPLFAEGDASPDAPIAPASARVPLIVVSHGTGGTAMDLSWLCAALAARGYIVASVDHPGNNALEAPTVAGATLWWLRADDLSRAIDGLLHNPNFETRIDPARIGAAGFSLGGYTVLAIAGATADPQRLEPYCARNPTTPLCTDESTPTIPRLRARSRELAAHDPLYRAALARDSESHRDPRVKAVFSIAPALGPATDASSLASIGIPIEIVAGFGDPILPPAENAIPDALALPNARLTIFPKPVGHYTFLTDCAPAGVRRFGPICLDAGPDRVAVHHATAALAVSFFERTLGLADR